MQNKKINNDRKYYSMNTFNENTYRHHPHDLSDPTKDMTLLEIIKYINSKDN